MELDALVLHIGLKSVCSISTGYNRFASDIAMMLGKKPIIFFQAAWVLITPLVLGVGTHTFLRVAMAK